MALRFTKELRGRKVAWRFCVGRLAAVENPSATDLWHTMIHCKRHLSHSMPSTSIHIVIDSSHLGLVGEGHPVVVQAKHRDNTQSDREWFLRLDGSWNAAPRENHAREQSKLDAVALSVLDSVSA